MGDEKRTVGEFPELLRTYRKKARLKQEELGLKAAISTASISYYESGSRVPRHPQVLDRIANALGLTDRDRENFLSSARISLGFRSEVNGVVSRLTKVFDDPEVSPGLKNRLGLLVKNAVDVWEEAKNKTLREAVIPVAGWQAHIMAPDITAQLLRRVIDETKDSGIERNIIVVAQSQERPLSEHLSDLREAKQIQLVVQERQLGLGHTIQVAQKILQANAPFAVVLPDENVDKSCFASMVKLYDEYRCCILALRKLDPEDSDDMDYGVAFYSKKEGNRCKVEQLKEKPSKVLLSYKALPIVGRYILTPDIFNRLERITTNQKSFEIELTDALDMMARRQAVYGYIYKGWRHCIAPTRAFWEGHLKKSLKPASE